VRPVVATVLLALFAVGCGGSDGDSSRPAGEGGSITVWILENQPERVRATEKNAAAFTRASGIKVKLHAVGDDRLAPDVDAALDAGTLPDVLQLPMAEAHDYARRGILHPDAGQEVVDELGEETFSARALSLLTSQGRLTAVPSDGWGQLLIYRKDLFDKAGLSAPASLEDVERAARTLQRKGLAGITLATGPDSFTGETFEHVALASGCQLVDDQGRIRLTSLQCRRAFATYVRLARRYSPGGKQDVDTTRDTYFAGRAAMIFWSPFLLDAMAGLRNEAVPTCRECRADPAFLARNSGLVGPLLGGAGAPAQYGTISTWGISAAGDTAGAKRFVTYMMSEGYLRWLALSPQGKYPVRAGDRSDPERYIAEWAGLKSGVERKAPLRRFYSEASIASLGAGVRNFQRWGFAQGQAALVGAVHGRGQIPNALAAAIAEDSTPAGAAREAQAEVERLKASVG
jgi:multiple sugar transport system substrate-binding protein